MMKRRITLLGIETSCDETAAAIVSLENGTARIEAEIVRTQLAEHAPYLGVVPEIAARAHAELADRTIAAAMRQAGLGYGDLDAVAATAGPGLIGGVLVGLMTGKAIAQAAGRPFIPINHLEGHALSPRLGTSCPFPYLLLLVSGGHCQFIEVRGAGLYNRLGSTIDDAVGEAFDKVAKLLGLGFPGGPAVERMAQQGNPMAFDFPRPLLARADLSMSFAGLKTAVARAADGATSDPVRADICASFQAAICDVLVEKSRRAIRGFDPQGGETRFIVAGGVAANKAIRAALETMAGSCGARLIAPPARHCTDNAAMIALAGAERIAGGLAPQSDSLAAPARPRWPLDESAARMDPVSGGGRRGARA